MGKHPGTGADRWALRSVPESQARRYVAEGWWNDDTLGVTVAEGLAHLGAETFQVHSKVRPWAGTFADVDRAARALAGALRARGVGPGSVVVLQLPNWVEAAISFWAAAYVGAVVIPIVHFYGAKEVEYILGATSPDVVVTAGRFGHNDYLAVYTELLRHHPVPLWLVAADGGAARDLPPGATAFESLLDGDPSPPPPPWTPAHRRSSASRRGRRATPRAWCTPTARSGARPASWTTCSPRAVPRGSPVRPWGTSSGCSTRS